MSGWLIYFITRCDYLQDLAVVGVVMGVVMLIISLILWSIYMDNGDDDMFKVLKVVFFRIAIPLTAIAAILFCTIPNSKEMSAIYLIPKIVANERVQELPNNALDVLNTKFEAWIEDMVPTGSKSDKGSK